MRIRFMIKSGRGMNAERMNYNRLTAEIKFMQD